MNGGLLTWGRMRLIALSMSLFTISAGVNCDNSLDPFEGPGVHVLFIGNSLTYSNDLPGTVAGIMRLAGEEMSYHTVVRPDFAVFDHYSGGSDAVEQVRRGGWHFVILQQGPSSLPESRASLIQWTVNFDRLIRPTGAMPALFMVWPSKDRFRFFEDVRRSYELAADTVGGLFLPAGEAWLTVWQDSAELDLYGPDDFHPSEMGSFLAALVMFEKLSGKNALDLPSEAIAEALNTTATTAALIQRAAHATNLKYKTSDQARDHTFMAATSGAGEKEELWQEDAFCR